MEQANIYDFLGVESDPLFNKISRLKKGQAFIAGDVKITLNNHEIYELSTKDEHEGFSNMLDCYKCISEMGIING